MYDSELTEAEEKESKSKAVAELKKVQDISSSKLADEYKSSKSSIEKAISSIKSEKTRDDLKKLVKLADKYVNGELAEADEVKLEEAAKTVNGSNTSNSKDKKTNKKTKTGNFIAGVLKFLIWVGIIGVGTVAGGAWVISKIGNVASVMVKGMKDVNKRLSESIELECADDAQDLEEADAAELDECGNPVEDSSPAAMVH